MKALVIAPGHSLGLSGKLGTQVLLPGTVIGPEFKSNPNLQDWIRDGIVIEQEFDEVDPAVFAPPAGAPTSNPSLKWGIASSELAGKSLDELNLLVRQIDPSIQPFETVEEAVYKLGSDLK